MKTYILVQAQPRADVSALVRDLIRLPGVDWAEPVRGPFDVIAEAADDVDLPSISAIRGVLRALLSPVLAPAEVA
ncbi:MAG: hypothetical protein ACRDGW_05075 [Actinomycetota bacterium]